MKINKGEWPIESYTDINAVCDLIKSWFRVLPGGMFPAPTHIKIMDVASKCSLSSIYTATQPHVQSARRPTWIRDLRTCVPSSMNCLGYTSICSSGLLSILISEPLTPYHLAALTKLHIQGDRLRREQPDDRRFSGDCLQS